MKEITKVTTHYIINVSIVLITMAALVIFHSLSSGVNEASRTMVPFLSLLVVSAISLVVTTIVFGKEKEKLYKIALPSIITVLILSLAGMLLLQPYYSFFHSYSYWSSFSEKPWMSIAMILYAIPVLIIISSIVFYGCKLSLISLSKDIATEWTIKHSWMIKSLKADIVHSKEFSYLIADDKMLVIRFITEDKGERLVSFIDDERNTKSPLVAKLEDKVKELELTNSNVSSALVYLSNKLPNTFGASNSVKVLKDKDLYNTFKELEGKGKIELEDIKERLS